MVCFRTSAVAKFTEIRTSSGLLIGRRFPECGRRERLVHDLSFGIDEQLCV